MRRTNATRLLVVTLAIAASSSPALPALGGPTIIRDPRVQDTAATPVLGRGYSISTNTFQSTCLKDVVITEPSYDFEYTFKDADSLVTEQSRTRTDTTAASKEVQSRVRRRKHWFFGTLPVPEANWVVKTVRQMRDVDRQSKTQTKNMLVNLKVDTYYASVDEANSRLSAAAAGLLTNEDVPGFLSACGPYYTRSISRTASFSSILNYTSTSEREDTKFQQSLKRKVFGWFSPFRLGSQPTSIAPESRTEFGTEANNKSLIIYSNGSGIGKDDNASLIATDTGSFRQAVEQAFISMQKPGTGRVASIEVVPWVENAEFQSLILLQGEDFIEQRPIPLYEKKDILTYNSEFVTELQRQGRNILNMHYKAKLCTTWIKSRWAPAGSLDEEAAEQALKNHRKPWETITLGELWQALRADQDNKSVATEYFNLYKDYMYDGPQNAMKCLSELFKDEGTTPTFAAGPPGGLGAGAPPGLGVTMLRVPGFGRGLFLERYFVHPECREMEARFGGVQLPEIIDDYCVPEPAT